MLCYRLLIHVITEMGEPKDVSSWYSWRKANYKGVYRPTPDQWLTGKHYWMGVIHALNEVVVNFTGLFKRMRNRYTVLSDKTKFTNSITV